MGFPTKNDHFGVFWGYHHLRKHPYHQRSTPKVQDAFFNHKNLTLPHLPIFFETRYYVPPYCASSKMQVPVWYEKKRQVVGGGGSTH